MMTDTATSKSLATAEEGIDSSISNKKSHRKTISFDPAIPLEIAPNDDDDDDGGYDYKYDQPPYERKPISFMTQDSELSSAEFARQRDFRRGGENLKVARPEDVTAQSVVSAIKTRDIVKIFTKDDDFIEVSPEQVARIKTMHARIQAGASFSFNYNVLLLVASVLAGLGLVSNSSATIIASMLVSPLMGPVVGLAYGSTIRDWRLVKKSLRNETLSLAFCIAMGVILAAITGHTKLTEDWPTEEMKIRGTLQNFLVALPVAFFSGLGVAVSILDDQTSSLVGVAISASLLPPAVDAGILWLTFFYTKHDVVDEDDLSQSDYRKMGVIALSLTIVNILLIWIASMLMFRLKEVLPIEKKVFWSDLGVARKIYQRRALLKECQVRETTTTTVLPGSSDEPTNQNENASNEAEDAV